jgi:hypothetical protein
MGVCKGGIHVVKSFVLDEDEYSALNSDTVSPSLKPDWVKWTKDCMDPRAGVPKTVRWETSIPTSNETLAIWFAATRYFMDYAILYCHSFN